MTPIDELQIFYNRGKSLNDALKVLTCASVKEITLILDKVNYYLEHVNVITSSSGIKKDHKELKAKQEFLTRLQSVLISELERRNRLHQVH